MLDPVAVRSYLGSLGQQQGGTQGGGVQALLANLRQRLYGSQAAQSLAGGQPQQGGEPAWMALRRAGQQGTGSAAGNRAAAAGLGGPQIQSQSFPVPVDSMTLPPEQVAQGGGGGGMQGGGPTGAGLNSQLSAPLMPPPGGGFGGSSGLPPGPPPPGATWKPEPGMADTGGGSFVGGNGRPVDYRGQPLPFAPGAPQPQPITGGGIVGTDGGLPAPPGGAPQFQSGGGLMAPQRNAMPKPTAPAGPQPSPVALGADQFRGPNARRIVNARQGIYNNVRQALRRPTATGGK